MFDSVTAAEDNMKSKLLKNSYREQPHGSYVTRLSRASVWFSDCRRGQYEEQTKVFDSVTAAEDNMKSKQPGAQKTTSKKVEKRKNLPGAQNKNGLKGRLVAQ